MLIQSNLVTMRSLEVEDAADFHKWFSDREITNYSLAAYSRPQSKADISNWLVSVNNNSKAVSLGICCKKTGALIGYAGIVSMSSTNRSGEYFILIGNKDYWNKGIGTDVTTLVTDYGFKVLGLHRIELTAFTNNPAAVKAYEKAGYVQEGIKRESGYRDGKFLDQVQMSVLSHEWKSI